MFLNSTIFASSVHRSSQDDANNSIARVVLMMIYSPCIYIQSKARTELAAALYPYGMQYLKPLMDHLHYVSSRDEFGNLDEHTSFSIVALICCSSLWQYRKYIILNEGIKMLLAFIKQ